MVKGLRGGVKGSGLLDMGPSQCGSVLHTDKAMYKSTGFLSSPEIAKELCSSCGI